MLFTEHAADVWTSEVPASMKPLHTFRMTVIRLINGSLWIHSPIPLSMERKAELDKLGSVTYVVAPSKTHHLSLNDYKIAYPSAEIWIAPGLEHKRSDLTTAARLDDKAQTPWKNEIAHVQIAGVPNLNEVVFYHIATRTLIVTDLLFNIQADLGLISDTANKLNGCYKRLTPSRFFKFCIRDRLTFKTSIEKILEWPFEHMILSHGEIVAARAHGRMKEAFQWL